MFGNRRIHVSEDKKGKKYSPECGTEKWKDGKY